MRSSRLSRSRVARREATRLCQSERAEAERQPSMPRGTTRPAGKESRNLAGRVSLFLSSRVCSYSPRNIVAAAPGSPLRATLTHFSPLGKSLAHRGERGLGGDAGLDEREQPLELVFVLLERSA